MTFLPSYLHPVPLSFSDLVSGIVTSKDRARSKVISSQWKGLWHAAWIWLEFAGFPYQLD